MRNLSLNIQLLAPDLGLPAYADAGCSAFDLYAAIEAPLSLAPGERMLVPTGIKLEIPVGYEGQVRPRSGLALKHGITVLNSPGTIDASYRGEIKIILINLSQDTSFEIHRGDRIAQLVIAPVAYVSAFVSVEQLSSSERQERGFGSTGV